MKGERKQRRRQAQAAANRRAYVHLAAGGVLALGLFIIALRVGPIAAPAQMVRAQAVHGPLIRPAAKLNPPVPERAATPGHGNPPFQRVGPPTALTPGSPRKSEYLPVSFENLAAFPFIVTDQMLDNTRSAQATASKTLAQIPDSVKGLNDKKVALQGYMLPMKYDHGLTTEFLILRSQGLCCYGVAPRITEWVNVRTAGKGVKPSMDRPLTVCGTFHVGDVRENGELVGVYSLDADKVNGPDK